MLKLEKVAIQEKVAKGELIVPREYKGAMTVEPVEPSADGWEFITAANQEEANTWPTEGKTPLGA